MITSIDIIIEDEKWRTLGFDVETLALEAIEIAIARATLPPVLKTNQTLELTALLTSDEAVQTLNRDFRGMDKPTNVLSFAAIDDPDCARTASLPGPFYLGDLALALQTLEREALEQDKVLKDHFLHLLIHGTLHLLGYDHQETETAEAMESLEIHILGGLNIENPYKFGNFVPD